VVWYLFLDAILSVSEVANHSVRLFAEFVDNQVLKFRAHYVLNISQSVGKQGCGIKPDATILLND
jgi:hypothetical protein